jgi:hypothetical protein
LARTGNAYLRPDLVKAAKGVRRHDTLEAADSQRRLTESTQPAHYRALVRTERKLLRDDRAYDPAHRPMRRRHG